MTATERSKTRRDRAARLLPVIALDEAHAEKLKALCEARGESASTVVRALIAAARMPRPKAKKTA